MYDSICRQKPTLRKSYCQLAFLLVFLLFLASLQTHLEQHGGKHLSHSLVEASDWGLQHRGHKDALVEVLLRDHGGFKFEEHQHLATIVPRCFNLTCQ